jgi:uracil phosphoribosyltransferase
MAFHLIDHPMAQEVVGKLRDKRTLLAEFRELARRLTIVLAIEATRDLKIEPYTVETPLEDANAEKLSQGIAAVPILRAGLGMLSPITELFENVSVGYIGLVRDESTAIASSYYCKLPELSGRLTLLLDPMLATGGTASQASDLVKAAGAEKIKLLSVVAAPEGVDRLSKEHPEVDVYCAALDRELNAMKYILPGLGDFGDRLYGTEG